MLDANRLSLSPPIWSRAGLPPRETFKTTALGNFADRERRTVRARWAGTNAYPSPPCGLVPAAVQFATMDGTDGTMDPDAQLWLDRDSVHNSSATDSGSMPTPAHHEASSP